ncbi:MAG: Ig-like domain-containing protein [Gemmataceae bacterium]
MLSTVLQACRQVLTPNRSRKTGSITPGLGVEVLEDRSVPSTFQVVEVNVAGTSSATSHTDLVGASPTTQSAPGNLDQLGNTTKNAGPVQTYMSVTDSKPTDSEYSLTTTSRVQIDAFADTVLDYNTASAEGAVSLTTTTELLVVASAGEQDGDPATITLTTSAAEQVVPGWNSTGTLTYTLGDQTGQLSLTDGAEVVLEGKVGDTLEITTQAIVSGAHVAYEADGGVGVIGTRSLGFFAKLETASAEPPTGPVVQLTGNSSANEGQTYSLDLSYSGDPGENPVTGWVVDWGDGNVENFTAGGSKTHVYADGANTYSMQVDLVVVGDETVATATKTVTINNLSPVAGDDSGASFTTHADTAFILPDLLTNDQDPGDDQITVTGVNTAATMGIVTDNGDGSFTYDPSGQFDQLADGDTAIDRFTYQISDGEGGTDTAEVEITIEGRNETPTVFRTINDQVTLLGQEYKFVLPLDVFTDVDYEDELTLSAKLLDGRPLPTWLTFDSENHTFQGTPTSEDHLGMLAIEITATDILGTSVSTDFTLTIRDSNQAPVLEPGNSTVEVNEGESVSVQGTFEDLENDSVTLTSSIGTISQDENGTWTWSFDTTDGPDEGQTVEITATDGLGDTTTTTFELIVNNVAPTIALSGNASVAAEQPYSLNLGDITDPGDDTVTQWVVDWGDGNVEVFLSGGVKLHTYAEGTYNIQVDLVDEDGTHTDRGNEVSVEVFGNQISISAITDQIVHVDQDTDVLSFTVSDVNTPAEDLLVSATSSDSALISQDGILLEGTGANRTVTVTPNSGQSGTTTITLTVSNSAGQTRTTSFDVRVNTPPELGEIANQTFANAQGSFSMALPARDAENDVLDFTVELTTYNSLYTLNQQFGFVSTRHQNYLDWNEKWLWSTVRADWYVLLPDGRLYETEGVAFGKYAGWAGPNAFQKVTRLTSALAPSVNVDVTTVVENGTVIFTPGTSFVGQFLARVTVSDGVDTDSGEFYVNVTNEGPQFDRSFENVSVSHADFPFTISGVTASDQDGETPTISVEILGHSPEYEVQQEYQFVESAYRNHLGSEEKWLWSVTKRAWFVLLKDGRLYATEDGDWGAFRKAVNSDVFESLDLLLQPEMSEGPAGVTAKMVGSDLVIDNANGHIGAFKVKLTASDERATTQTEFVVESTNAAPEFNREVKNIVVSGDQVPVTIDGIMAIDANGDSVAITTQVTDYSMAYDLHQRFDFVVGSYRNLWELDEKWLFSRTRQEWHVLLPDGRLYQTRNNDWGDYAGTLSTEVHNDLTLLTNAKAPDGLPGITAVIADGDLELNVPNGYSGTFKVTLTASDGMTETTQWFYVTVLE